ncbi:MAG: hypothetical protein V2J11_00345, partial [Desulfofustis sp.]|nr:hypothetical protein [Desulfofustis sp.]
REGIPTAAASLQPVHRFLSFHRDAAPNKYAGNPRNGSASFPRKQMFRKNRPIRPATIEIPASKEACRHCLS